MRRLEVMPTLKSVHHRGADRAQDYFALIEHCELNGHPIEVVAQHLALLQLQCEYSSPVIENIGSKRDGLSRLGV